MRVANLKSRSPFGGRAMHCIIKATFLGSLANLSDLAGDIFRKVLELDIMPMMAQILEAES